MKKFTLSHRDVAGLCRSLSLLVHAGVGLGDSLFLLAEESEGQIKNLLTGLGQQIDQGVGLSAALEESGVFPAYVTGMVQVGERSGRIEEALGSLAAYYDELDRTQRQARNALAYPALLLLLMLAVIAVLLIRVLPVFDEVYASLGGQLTGIAAGLLHLGEVLQAALPVLLVILVLGVVFVLVFSRNMSFRERVMSLWRKKMGDRGVWKKLNNARFARALAMGLSSGLSLEESVTLGEMLLLDVPGAAGRCGRCAEQLAEGVDLARALGEAELLPAASCRLLTVGIRGGNGDRVMEEIADRLMDDAYQTLETTVSRVEPAMVLTASLLVGIILLAVMLPLMNIMSSIG